MLDVTFFERAVNTLLANNSLIEMVAKKIVLPSYKSFSGKRTNLKLYITSMEN